MSYDLLTQQWKEEASQWKWRCFSSVLTWICLPLVTTFPSCSQVMLAGGELSPDTHWKKTLSPSLTVWSWGLKNTSSKPGKQKYEYGVSETIRRHKIRTFFHSPSWDETAKLDRISKQRWEVICWSVQMETQTCILLQSSLWGVRKPPYSFIHGVGWESGRKSLKYVVLLRNGTLQKLTPEAPKACL